METRVVLSPRLAHGAALRREGQEEARLGGPARAGREFPALSLTSQPCWHLWEQVT